ncbi:hypothetical protein [Streptomyces sp. NPDC002221]|uniref:hypothetical protein n=1 Tax=Streptomyces sp. NPDC002221 TaxID=3364639 RepID=UPI00367C7B6A
MKKIVVVHELMSGSAPLTMASRRDNSIAKVHGVAAVAHSQLVGPYTLCGADTADMVPTWRSPQLASAASRKSTAQACVTCAELIDLIPG